MTPEQHAQRIYQIAIDYRTKHSGDCVLFATIRATSEAQAIEKAKRRLRKHPLVRSIGEARCELSGWNR